VAKNAKIISKRKGTNILPLLSEIREGEGYLKKLQKRKKRGGFQGQVRSLKKSPARRRQETNLELCG